MAVQKMAESVFAVKVKGVADVGKIFIVLGAEMQFFEDKVLLSMKSIQHTYKAITSVWVCNF